jgi:hypothetical protein
MDTTSIEVHHYTHKEADIRRILKFHVMPLFCNLLQVTTQVLNTLDDA